MEKPNQTMEEQGELFDPADSRLIGDALRNRFSEDEQEVLNRIIYQVLPVDISLGKRLAIEAMDMRDNSNATLEEIVAKFEDILAADVADEDEDEDEDENENENENEGEGEGEVATPEDAILDFANVGSPEGVGTGSDSYAFLVD